MMHDTITKTKVDFVANEIIRKRGCRKVLSWGNIPQEVVNLLYEKHGIIIENEVYLVKNSKLSDDGWEQPFEKYTEKSAEYLLVKYGGMPDDQAANMLKQMGHSPEDCIFFNHKAITLDGPVAEYSDDYGNIIANIPANVTIIIEGYGNTITFGKKTISNGTSIRVKDGCVVDVGENVQISGNITCFLDQWTFKVKDGCLIRKLTIDFHKRGSCTFGTGSTALYDCQISVGYEGDITIGEDCMFAEAVMVICGDCHAIFDTETGARINGPSAGNPKMRINLGNHVWVGKKACILGGSKIGNGSIIGAMTVYKGECPNNVVIVGNPGRIIRKNVAWARPYITNSIQDCLYYENTKE